jgi:hypothetical protein
MPKFTEIVDSKSKIIRSDSSAPGFPSVAEMQESQRKGAEGIGLNKQSYNEDQADFNQASGSYDASSPSGAGRAPSLPWKP